MKDYPLNIFEYITKLPKTNVIITDQIRKNADKVMDMLSQEIPEEEYQIIVDRFKNKMNQKAVKEKYNISLDSIRNIEYKAYWFFREHLGTLLSNDEINLRSLAQRRKEYYKHQLKCEEEEYKKRRIRLQKKINAYDELSKSPLSDIEEYFTFKIDVTEQLCQTREKTKIYDSL